MKSQKSTLIYGLAVLGALILTIAISWSTQAAGIEADKPAAAEFDVRAEAYEILHGALPAGRRRKSDERLEILHKLVRGHKGLHGHPALSAMYGQDGSGDVSKEAVLGIHEDFRALTRVFTDQITSIALGTRELREPFGDDVAMASRFLVFLNLLDELGFAPGDEEYRGSPMLSHHMLFEKVIAELSEGSGVQEKEKTKVEAASKVLNTIDDSSFLSILLYLIVTEEEAMVFSPAMRSVTGRAGVDVNEGYYMVHGSSEDDTNAAFDDLHQNDGWAILALLLDGMDESEFYKVHGMMTDYLDVWCEFWDAHYADMHADDAAFPQGDTTEAPPTWLSEIFEFLKRAMGGEYDLNLIKAAAAGFLYGYRRSSHN